jgi:hypothetical protein
VPQSIFCLELRPAFDHSIAGHWPKTRSSKTTSATKFSFSRSVGNSNIKGVLPKDQVYLTKFKYTQEVTVTPLRSLALDRGLFWTFYDEIERIYLKLVYNCQDETNTIPCMINEPSCMDSDLHLTEIFLKKRHKQFRSIEKPLQYRSVQHKAIQKTVSSFKRNYLTALK